MAYQMKSSPAKIMGAIKIGSKVLNYGRKAYQKIRGTYVDKNLKKRTGYSRRVDLEEANRIKRQRYGGPDHVK